MSLTKRAVVTREFAGWTSAIELNPTDATYFILRNIPVPSSNGIPFFNGDLHCGGGIVESQAEEVKRREKHRSTADAYLLSVLSHVLRTVGPPHMPP